MTISCARIGQITEFGSTMSRTPGMAAKAAATLLPSSGSVVPNTATPTTDRNQINAKTTPMVRMVRQE